MFNLLRLFSPITIYHVLDVQTVRTVLPIADDFFHRTCSVELPRIANPSGQLTTNALHVLWLKYRTQKYGRACPLLRHQKTTVAIGR